MKRKILTIFGTRPEAIKLAPVIKALEKKPDSFDSRVCVTGQHRQMLDQVLSLFQITPDLDLNLMKPNQSLFYLTSKLIAELESVFEQFKPDVVLVQGDTSSAFITALAAFYRKLCVGHVEAGLRTYRKYSPFPEEVNRRLLSVVADFHYAPTEWAFQNLLAEKIPSEQILITGNTVIDAVKYIASLPDPGLPPELQKVKLPARLILVTAHRRESFGQPFREMCEAMRDIAELRSEVGLIYPVHLNPNVRKPVMDILIDQERIFLIEPMEYLPFIHLMKRCYLVLTDSGGIQEEAPSFGKPVLVMRENTERPEGVTAGTVKLVGTDKENIVQQALQLLDDQATYDKMAQTANPYGDGRAAERIVTHLEK